MQRCPNAAVVSVSSRRFAIRRIAQHARRTSRRACHAARLHARDHRVLVGDESLADTQMAPFTYRQDESPGIAAGAPRRGPKQLSQHAVGLLGPQAHPFVADLRRRVTLRRAWVGALSLGRHTNDCALAVKPDATRPDSDRSLES